MPFQRPKLWMDPVHRPLLQTCCRVWFMNLYDIRSKYGNRRLVLLSSTKAIKRSVALDEGIKRPRSVA
ncbi:hypothetical protein V8C44DRAFT_319245 [Trichoderma aethiopicum]